MNPISKDYEVMRTFIAPNILKAVAYNLNRGARNLRFFEMGKVFYAGHDTMPREYPSICLAMTGKEKDYFWRDACPEYDFFDIKGVLEGFETRFKVKFDFVKSNEPFLKEVDLLKKKKKKKRFFFFFFFFLMERMKIGWSR